MSLIDRSYFVLDCHIPITQHTAIEDYITRYEPVVLRRLLGYDLYKLVSAYDPLTSEQRIIDIVEGKEYAYDSDHYVKWNGLKCTDKQSPIAYYVYAQFVRINASSLMPIGNVVMTGENSTRSDVSQKLQMAWQRLRELSGYPGQDALEPSLYNFLAANEADYPEWIYTDIGRINSFDV